MKSKGKLLCFLTSISLVACAIGFSVSPKAQEVKADELKTENTEVFSINVENGGDGWIFLGFCLSNYDYKSTGGKEILDYDLDNSGANVKTKILDQDGNLLSYNTTRANRYRTGRIVNEGTAYSFCLYLNGTVANPGFTKIVVPAETTFPSYNLANNLLPETRTDLYKTTEEMSFTYDSVTKKFVRDAKESEKVEVDLTSLKLVQQANTKEYFYMSFGLSTYDWVQPEGKEDSGTLQNATWFLNTVSNLQSKVYVGDNLASFNAARGTRFRCAYSSYQIVVNGNYEQHGITKVTVKAGAMFPAKATGMGAATKDLDGNNAGWVATEIKFYVLKADTTFVLDDDPSTALNTFVLESEYATALATLKSGAKTELEAHNGGASNYTINKTSYEAAIATAETAIDACTKKTEVPTALANGKTAIDAVESDSTILTNEKNNKKTDLTTQYNELKTTRIIKGTELATKFANGKVAITNVTKLADLDGVYNSALKAMQDVPTDTAVRTDAKQDVDSYKGGANAFKLHEAEYNEAHTTAYSGIEDANTEEAINSAVSGFKATIDTYQDDATIKAGYVAQVDAKKDSLDMSKYTEENQTKINDLISKAKTDIASATSITALDGIITKLDEDINNVPVINKGCGGSIIASSAILSILSLAGAGLLLIKRKEDK